MQLIFCNIACAGILLVTASCSFPSTPLRTPATTGRSTTRTASSGATMTGTLLTATTTMTTATACRPAASSARPRQLPRKACLIWQVPMARHRSRPRHWPQLRPREAPIARPARGSRGSFCASRWPPRRRRRTGSGPRDTLFWLR